MLGAQPIIRLLPLLDVLQAELLLGSRLHYHLEVRALHGLLQAFPLASQFCLHPPTADVLPEVLPFR